MDSATQRNIVIIGGGIIGCTTAYYLSRHPSFSPTTVITILEASSTGVAQGASGKAGGLVAKWAYPRELVDVSFSEHCKLSEEHDGSVRWGWRFVSVGSWEGRGQAPPSDGKGAGVRANGAQKSLEKTTGLPVASGQPKALKGGQRRKGLPEDLNWVREELTDNYTPMAAKGDTAQVHPRLFTTSMLELAQERGVRVVIGRATAIERENGRVARVKFVSSASDAEQTLPATDILLSAGAWSPSLVPTLPIRATRAHSITIRTNPETSIAPYALFTEIAYSSVSGRTESVSPEIYARPDGELYACGPGDSSPLPNTVDDVQCDETACESIHAHVTSISDELAAGTITSRQACFLPTVVSGGGPIVGSASKIAQGLFVAAGHTCWGICNAPGTAKAMSELILEGRITCADLSKLAPSKYLI